ncbi:helix-turn-helix transcriptional regulator [Tenggerimyces flavus]|uniref:Helix-turn-helix transcriptional regulator n=1 Tax=Tenggerimyces flavus TaxID=1708749 RepID=A0ABV7YAH0_9ACTN|nr:helix-turn-helix transcriptional regulator [Tenggerimyces flavus]MBM7785103.1 transcriptional regulator with XRE-family HTH domain [Tenggerimyces flavus]
MTDARRASSTTPTRLGEYLRTRRAQLSPEDAGVVSYGARRVPGLRREELAQLAGVSATYYTRLEQGQSANASEAVIDALATALDLDDDERAHLHTLAKPAKRKRTRAPKPARASRNVRQLLGALIEVPAVVIDRRSDVLAWNALGRSLLAGHLLPDAPDDLADRPNLTRMLFLDPHHRDLYPRWQEEAARAVASLRVFAGRSPDDRVLAELVGELSVKSAEFAALWSKHPVANCVSGTKQFRHPEVGELELTFEALYLAEDEGQRILLYSAESGSPSEAALRLLGR